MVFIIIENISNKSKQIQYFTTNSQIEITIQLFILQNTKKGILIYIHFYMEKRKN